MSRAWGPKSIKTLSEVTADALNRLFNNIVIMSMKNEIRHLFDTAVIGYGSKVGSALPTKSVYVLPDEFAKRLFRMSSLLPSSIIEKAISDGWQLDNNARGYLFNVDSGWIAGLPLIFWRLWRNPRYGTKQKFRNWADYQAQYGYVAPNPTPFLMT